MTQILPLPLVGKQCHATHGTDEQSASKTMLVNVTDLWFMTEHMRTGQKAVDAKGWCAFLGRFFFMPRANFAIVKSSLDEFAVSS